MTKYFSILLLFTLFISCSNRNSDTIQAAKVLEKIQFQGEAQGTYYAITYFDTDGRNLQPQIDSLLKAFDLSASNYVENSVISKVNRNEEVVLDSIFIGNFLLAQRISDETQGMFDITVRPLVELWGFGLKNRQHVNDKMVKDILPLIGYKKVKLEEGKIVKSDTAIKLDFNAIAQGYSVDVVSKFLESKGITIYLIDIGGEVFARNHKPDGKKWTVGIEKPEDNAEYGQGLMTSLPLENQGMATSGNYRKFYEENGVRYSHTINPLTGYPAKNTLLSATVIYKTAAEADCYATSFMVMGLEKSKEFLQKHPDIKVYFIFNSNQNVFDIYTNLK